MSMSGAHGTAEVSDVRSGVQCGERGVGLDQAWEHGQAALSELGLTAQFHPVPVGDPGSWRCFLRRDGSAVTHGDGSGKGPEDVARVGALFEAFEHYFSFDTGRLVADRSLRAAHQVAAGPLAAEPAIGLLAEGPDTPLACLPYRSLTDGTEHHAPAFVSLPEYVEPGAASTRAAAGDGYDYSVLGRYANNSGWAAGISPVEAMVHAINEAIERDASSLLLIDQFLAAQPPPPRIVDPSTLPAQLAAPYRDAEARLGRRVWLIDITTDLEVPAFWAYALPPRPGQPAEVRGFGASLSRRYAAERALAELIQCHSVLIHENHLMPERHVGTEPYPPLHNCYLTDLTGRLADAMSVPFTDTAAPGTPHDHLNGLLQRLHRHGLTAYVRQRYTNDHLAVLHVLVPGLERFIVVTDGIVVFPGTRGRSRLHGGNGGGR